MCKASNKKTKSKARDEKYKSKFASKGPRHLKRHPDKGKYDGCQDRYGMKSTYDRDPSGNNNKQCGDIALFGPKRHDRLIYGGKS